MEDEKQIFTKSPDAFRTISEASDELGVPPHVLRFWEGKFTHLRPLKRAGGRRFYRAQDMALLRGLKAFLQDDGYTIRGVQKLIKDGGIQSIRDRGNATSFNVETSHDEISNNEIIIHRENHEASNSHKVPAALTLQQAIVRLEQAKHLLDKALNNYSK